MVSEQTHCATCKVELYVSSGGDIWANRYKACSCCGHRLPDTSGWYSEVEFICHACTEQRELNARAPKQLWFTFVNTLIADYFGAQQKWRDF